MKEPSKKNNDTKSKYVLATIAIPIEITPDGDQITHTELYSIDFSVLDFLPNPSEQVAEIDISQLFSCISDKATDEFAFRSSESGTESGESESRSGSESESEYETESDSDGGDFLFREEYRTSIPEDESETMLGSREGGLAPPVVHKNEIQTRRAFPRSKTFRRFRSASTRGDTRPGGIRNQRFSRRSDMRRFIHVPKHILNTLGIRGVGGLRPPLPPCSS